MAKKGGLGKGLDAIFYDNAREDDAGAVARLQPGVIGRIRACAQGNAWCEVQVGEYRGWLKRAEMFGVTADEVIGG